MLVVKVASSIGRGLGIRDLNTVLLMPVPTNPVLDPFAARASPL
jgi:hypothetical protein